MSARCLSDSCTNGNCLGCRNGSLYCNDPRCYPDCPGCEGKTNLECLGGRNGWDWTLIVIVGVLVLLVLILMFVMYQRITPNNNKKSEQLYEPLAVPLNPNNPNVPQIEIRTIPGNTISPVNTSMPIPPNRAPMPFSPNPTLDSTLNSNQQFISSSRPISQRSFT